MGSRWGRRPEQEDVTERGLLPLHAEVKGSKMRSGHLSTLIIQES